MKHSRLVVLLGVLSMGATGCTTIKPYEKEYLLSPAMDDQVVAGLSPTMAGTVLGASEKLSSSAPAAGGTACPTCGG